jgi:hypothetical protein
MALLLKRSLPIARPQRASWCRPSKHKARHKNVLVHGSGSCYGQAAPLSNVMEPQAGHYLTNPVSPRPLLPAPAASETAQTAPWVTRLLRLLFAAGTAAIWVRGLDDPWI